MVAGFGSALAAGRRNAALRASFSGATLGGGAGRCLSTADHAAPDWVLHDTAGVRVERMALPEYRMDPSEARSLQLAADIVHRRAPRGDLSSPRGREEAPPQPIGGAAESPPYAAGCGCGGSLHALVPSAPLAWELPGLRPRHAPHPRPPPPGTHTPVHTATPPPPQADGRRLPRAHCGRLGARQVPRQAVGRHRHRHLGDQRPGAWLLLCVVLPTLSQRGGAGWAACRAC